MLEFYNQFFERLESEAYDIFKDNNPKKTVSLMTSNLYLKRLRKVMEQALGNHESLREDIVTYVELLCEEAKAFEKYKQRNKKKTHIPKNRIRMTTAEENTIEL